MMKVVRSTLKLHKLRILRPLFTTQKYELVYLTFRLSKGIAITPPLGTDACPDETLLVFKFEFNELKGLEETAKRLMAESDCIVATGDRIFRRSHILALLSSDPEMIFSSLDVNTADVTVS